LKWYENHFALTSLNKKTGEIAPSYFHCQKASTRIFDLYPNCKIICTLREPAERLFSLYLHYLRNGYTNLPFLDSLEHKPEIMQTGMYFTHLKKWIQQFGQDRCLVLFYEDLKADSHRFMNQIYQFLELEPHFEENKLSTKVNVGTLPKYPRLASLVKKLSNKIREQGAYDIINLFKFFQFKKFLFSGGKAEIPDLTAEQKKIVRRYLNAEICNLEKLLNVDLTHWK